MADPSALVLMATYNGEAWLGEQLDSLQLQEFENWRLLVSDDGSQDATMTLLQQRADADPRISVLPAREGPAGHVGNFEYLLAQAQGESLRKSCAAIFLADQDDHWLPDKLARQVQDLEAGAAAVCSDLVVIDASGSSLGGYWEVMGLDPDIRLRDHLSQNAVVGCSLALRPELLELALPFPEHLQNHDWWLSLCALATDGLGVNRDRLLQYRQHGGNTIGVRDRSGQWQRRTEIIRRQRRIIDSKVIAVGELITRLERLGKPVPDELREFSDAFEGRGRAGRMRALLGPFRPQRASLLLIQLLALLR